MVAECPLLSNTKSNFECLQQRRSFAAFGVAAEVQAQIPSICLSTNAASLG